MITIFTIPKEFKDPHIKMIQTNAILSWKHSGFEVILMGDDEGVAEFAKENELKHFPDIARNDHGTPLLNWAFKKASAEAEFEKIMYSNADIIFTSDFFRVLEALPKSNFLLVGQRMDFEQKEYIQFTEGWDLKIIEKAKSSGTLHSIAGIDYFLHSRHDWDDLSDLAVGRAGWDNLVIYTARKRKIKVIDATNSVSVLHQNHDHTIKQVKNGRWSGPERDFHLSLLGNSFRHFTINDCNYILNDFRLEEKKIPMMKRFYYLGFTPEIYFNNQILNMVIGTVVSFFYRAYNLIRYRRFKS